MSNTIRIRTTPNGGDKYLKLQLDQEFDFIEILSLKLTQEDVYRKFSSDYGVIAGRVIVNSGFGVPNAKISVFIPLDEIDKDNPLISGLYPYEVVTDKNSDGIRYNLLTSESSNDDDCFTPIGTFPTKREVLDNEALLSVYCKYYKFTTTSNYAGDFMLFGVPVGNHVIHVDVDISDIGIISQRPYDLIRQGTPVKMFDSPTKFKGGTNLDRLVQIKTSNIGVNVQPFWGDTENYEIGITRVDVDLNYNITPCAIFMGSIYGDQDKNSINKLCQPRKALGELCQQVTGSGSVDMIRKTIDNKIEEFSVDGGRVIDDDGTWAYQIPMNLDYMVTDENGDLRLSQDPNVGIPTRASVRFKIGMDETGGEGRFRTRAKYLVPNNPKSVSEIDYEFGEKTKDTSFKDLYWNKIYSVSNFITRYQKNGLAINRNMTAMKNIDACVGDKTPFPFNKVSGQVNPIFFIICLIIKIIGFLIYIMNRIILPIINSIINIIRSIVDFINNLGGNLTKPDYVSCLTVQCPADDGGLYAPGCKDSDYGFSAAVPPPNYYCGDPDGHGCGIAPLDLVGLDDCIAFEMAKSLGLFQFDFYNDWVNGSLFSFLLKYRKRRKGRERFCEYDCSDFPDGTDGNNNGFPDNPCRTQMMIDTCYNCDDNVSNVYNCQKSHKESLIVREGLIKKLNDEFYYAATTHNLGYKLFATDLICLGSVLDCDWQGLPKLQPYLTPTTYNIPPDTQERSDDNTVILESGMVDIGGNTTGLFFSINCLGVHVNPTQCLNLRHICEIGVNGDEYVEDSITGAVISQADGTIGLNDIDPDGGKTFRDSFLVLNSGTTSVNSFILNQPMSNEFNLNNTLSYYGFATNNGDNGENYLNFRGYPVGADDTYAQPEHSYYFYFGLNAGKTALDKMNQRYFTQCIKKLRNDIVLDITTTPDSDNTNSGSISIDVIGGHHPYQYTVNGPNGYFINGSTSLGPQNIFINGLGVGNYTITVIDTLGSSATQSVNISGPTPLYCSVSVTQTPSSASANDGAITVTQIGGGIPPYSYVLQDYLGGIISSGVANQPLVLGGLAADNNFGYTVTISDSNGDSCVTTGIIISGPSVITLSSTVVNTTCYNSDDGEIHLTANGYVGLITVTTNGPSNFVGNTLNMTALKAGVYTTTIVDSMGSTAMLTTTVASSSPPLIMTQPTATELSRQCDSANYHIPFYITAGLSVGSTAYVEYLCDNSTTWVGTTIPFVNSSTPLYLVLPKTAITSSVKIRFSDTPTHNCNSNILTFNTSAMALPLVNLNGSITATPLGGGNYTHNIVANGGIGVLNGSPYNIGVTSIITNAHITTTIIDSVGCTVVLQD